MRLSESLVDSGKLSTPDLEWQFSRSVSDASKPQPNRCFSPLLDHEENSMRRLELIKSMFPNVPDAVQRYGNLIPDNIPPGVNIIENLKSSNDMGPWEFYESVKGKGKWDYKQQDSKYQEFGNWAFAVESRGFSRGIVPDWIFKRGAGWAQEQAGTSKPQWGHWWGGGSFGDDPYDQRQIENGFKAIDTTFRLLEPIIDSKRDRFLP